MTQRLSPQELIAHLRLERRSYIIGTLLVWAIIITAVGLLFISMEPGLFAKPQPQTLQAEMVRVNQTPPLTWEQQMVIDAVVLVGAIALFFLNWRFSFLLQRPRGAFVSSQPGRSPSGRWIWWAVLSLNSLFYISLLIPQLVVTWLLARWGSEEIARHSALPPSTPPAEPPL